MSNTILPEVSLDIYDQKIWRKGCNYMVGQPDDLCSKCNERHNQDAYEAEVGIFKKDSNDEKTSH